MSPKQCDGGFVGKPLGRFPVPAGVGAGLSSGLNPHRLENSAMSSLGVVASRSGWKLRGFMADCDFLTHFFWS